MQKVEWLAGTLLAAWQFPKLEREAKLLYSDDIAGLFMDFGHRRLEEAIEYERQHATERRPTIGKLREYCDAHKPQTTPNTAALEHDAFLRDLRRRPEKYIPVEYCMQVGKELSATKGMRAKTSHPMTESEYRDLRLKLTKEMNDRWLDELRAAKKPGMTEDHKTVATGER